MGQGIPGHFALDKYGIAPADVVRSWLHCEPEPVERRAIVMPTWRPAIYASLAKRIEEVVAGILYRLECQGQAFSLLRSGMGAPATGEFILALGCTACDTVVFAGSAGGLGMGIGDVVVPGRASRSSAAAPPTRWRGERRSVSACWPALSSMPWRACEGGRRHAHCHHP